MKHITYLAVAVALGCAMALPAKAETVLKLAIAAPEKTPWGDQIKRLAEAVAEESGGRLRVEPYYNSQLGTENDTIAQVARGRLEMGVFTLNAGAQQAPELSLMKLPGYFETFDQRICVQDKYLTEEARSRLSGKGIYFGAWAEVGTGVTTAKQEIRTVEDLSGLKIGISSNKINTEVWKVMGANPVPVSPGEAASAGSTGLIDVYPTVFSFYIPSGLNKVLPIVSDYNYDNVPGMFAMSQRTFDRLSAEDQEAIKRAYARLDPYQVAKEIAGFEEVMRGMHIKSGGTYLELTAEEKATFRDRLPAFWDEMFADAGEDGAAIKALLEEGMANCPK